MALLAGLSKRDITPPLGLPLDGYDARTGTATGVLDPLAARVLYLAHGERRACVVSLDLLGVRARFAERLRRELEAATGVARGAVIVAATHTHAGPAGIASAEHRSARLARYGDALVERVADAAAEAQAAARPCSLRIAARNSAGIAANRIDPGAPVDPHVRVLRLSEAHDDSLCGLVVHFACHPTVLGEDNLAYSGDFVGRALATLERSFGVPCLFLQGASADVSTRFTRASRNAAEADRLGQTLAAVVHDAALGPAQELAPELATVRQPVGLPRRAQPDRQRAEALVRRATEELRRAVDDGLDPGLTRRLQVRLTGAQHLLQASAAPTSGPITTTLTGLRLGDVALAAIPGELFHETAAGIDGYGSDWLPITLANGYLGYFPTASSIAAQEYESLYTTFDDRATAELARAVERLIEGLRAGEA